MGTELKAELRVYAGTTQLLDTEESVDNYIKSSMANQLAWDIAEHLELEVTPYPSEFPATYINCCGQLKLCGTPDLHYSATIHVFSDKELEEFKKDIAKKVRLELACNYAMSGLRVGRSH